MLYIVKQDPKGRARAHYGTTVQVVEAATKKDAIAAVLANAPNDFSESPHTLYEFCRVQAAPLELGKTYRFF